MTSLLSCRREAKRTGYELWMAVPYEHQARQIRNRLNAEVPKADASVGVVLNCEEEEDGADVWVVWYRPWYRGA